MWLFVVVSISAWFFWAPLTKAVANQLWPSDAAPWERVAAIYYPDNSKTYNYQIVDNLKNVSECRDVVNIKARLNGDPDYIKGDYLCFVGREYSSGPLSVYRLTVK